MKIYSNHLTEADVRHAFTMARIKNGADIYVEEIKSWTPRKYAYGVEVWAVSLHGTRATGHVPAGHQVPRRLPACG